VFDFVGSVCYDSYRQSRWLSERETMNINLSTEDTALLVSCLQGLSDRITKEHEESFSGVDRLMLISAIQKVDRLAVEIREQLEAETIRPS
jgi:hypothetical protein